MAKKYNKAQYKVQDMLHYAHDHIQAGKRLFCGRVLNHVDSGGYLIHLGIELYLKAMILDKDGEFGNLHNLIELSDKINLNLSTKQMETLTLVQNYYDLRYPQPNGSISLGSQDWGAIESLIICILDQMSHSVKGHWNKINPLEKGGRVLMVHKGFSIGKAAKYLGVTAQTLRNWEKKKILVPSRQSNNYRHYNIDDLEYIKANYLK